jgi:hypothetical protein
MPRDCNSSAMPRTVVIPERLMSSTMPRRSAACWAALALMDATASVLPTCLPWSARAPLGLPSFTPRAFGAAIALLVRSPIKPASNSATAAICVSRSRPIGPAGTLGRSQKTRSTSLATRDRSRSTLRVRRSNFANTSLALMVLACARAAASLGRSDRRPLSVLTYSAATVQRPPFR